MRFFGYPYNDLVICKDSPDYLAFQNGYTSNVCKVCDFRLYCIIGINMTEDYRSSVIVV